MASVGPNLLSLPREIRDKILSYLHRDIEYEGPLYTDATDDRYMAVSVRLENAPLLNVLLTHSQIRDEYKDADCFRKLSAILRWGTSPWVLMDPNAPRITDDLIFDALARASNVTVTVSTIPMTDLYTLGSDLAKLGASHVPNLDALRIIFWTTCGFLKHEHLKYYLSRPLATTMLDVPIPFPIAVAGLPVTKRGRGFHVGHTFMLGYDNPTNELAHKISRVEACCYGLTNASTKHWTQANIVDVQKPLPYQPYALSELPEDAANELVERSSKVLEWGEETRGQQAICGV